MAKFKKSSCLPIVLFLLLVCPPYGFGQSSKLVEQLNLQPLMRVADDSGLWTGSDQIASRLTFDAVKRDVKIDFRVIIVRSLQSEDLFTFTTAAFEKLKIGDATANRGGLIVVAINEKRVRFQVTKAIEPVFTDAFIGYIERNQMVPYFDRKELHPGIHATIELAVKRAYDSLKMNTEQIKQDDLILQSKYRTGGGGASAQFGKGSANSPATSNSDLTEYSAQPTPELAWQKFYQLHERKVMNPQVDIFDDRAKEMAKRYTVASLDFIAKLYANKKPTFRSEGERAAVIFLDDPNFELAPWFFKKSNKGWQLDGSAYPNLIKFNHLNQWRLTQNDHPYMFAFRDFSIDSNGYATSPIKLGIQINNGNSPAGKRSGWIGSGFLYAPLANQFFSTQQKGGVILHSIASTGAAGRAGLEEGDIVTELNGVRIANNGHLVKMLQSRIEGDVVELEVTRGLCKSDLFIPLKEGNLVIRPVTKNKAPPTKMKVKVTLLGSRDGK